MSTRHKHPEGALCASGGFYPPLQVAFTTQRTAQFRGLRADAIRPYSCGGRAADGSTASRPHRWRIPFIQPLSFAGCGRILSAPTVWVGKLLPFIQPLSFAGCGRILSAHSLGGEAAAIQRTAQLRTLREAKSLPYRLRSFRFISVSLPGRFGNQRIGTGSVRHCPAALPPLSVFPSGRRGLDLFFSHSQGIMHW